MSGKCRARAIAVYVCGIRHQIRFKYKRIIVFGFLYWINDRCIYAYIFKLDYNVIFNMIVLIILHKKELS